MFELALVCLESIGEVVVKGELLKTEDSAYTATVLRSEEIRQKTPGDIDELLRSVPGMAVRDLQLGSVANSIVIRGFGNGGHGGDLGAVIDGIPLNEAMSHADGYVDLNVIIPLEIDSFTVLKGPVSALYGNYNRGGMVNVQTRKTGDYAELDLSGGSFETFDLQGAFGSHLGDTQQVNVAAQTFRTDGYRPQSDTKRSVFAGRWSGNVTPALQLALSSRYLNAESNSASYLTLQQFQSNPRGIDPRVLGDGADKEFLTLRGDANYSINDDLKLLTFAYTTQQDFTRWFTRPVGNAWLQREETYDRDVFGAGTSLNGVATPATVRISYVAGVETFRESTDYRFFDGLTRRVRPAPATTNRQTDLNSVSAFTEVQADVHPLAQLFFGLRADRFTGGCERRATETTSDPCGPLKEASHASPKIGIHSRVAEGVTLRASWAEGFALGNGFVKYAVGGQPLDENVFRQTEIGAHLALASTLDFDVAAYRLTSTGEFRTVAPGVFENFGGTLRRGFEASLLWKPLTSLDLSATYGLSDTEITENGDARLLGLAVAGVPKDSGSLEATFRPFTGWSLNATWRYVGEYEVDALNTVEASSFGVYDVGAAYTSNGDRSYRAYVRVENVTDREYATSVSIIGGQQLFAPGAPRAVRAGIQFNF